MDALSSLTAAWNAKIPIKLALSPSDITSPTEVKPVYFLAPRQGYLPVLAQQALRHFQHVLPNLPGGKAALKPWFEYQGMPLRWHLPAGVLHDLLAGEGELPWMLQIHYTNFPAALQGGWENDLPLQQHYFNSLKEACFICCGPLGSGAVMQLTPTAQDEMWRSVERADLASYKQIMDGVRAKQRKVAPTAWRDGQGASIPVRIFVRQPSSQGLLGLWEHTSSSSRPWPAQQHDGSATTLQHLLQGMAPGLFADAAPGEQQQQQEEEEGETSSSAAAARHPLAPHGAEAGAGAQEGQGVAQAAAAAAEPEARQEEQAAGGSTAGSSGASQQQGAGQRQQQQRQRPRLKVLVAGVSPPLETPLAWLHAHLHAPDYFLYVVVRADLAR